MNRDEYRVIEAYMRGQMQDSSHDCQHIYRVLYAALEIAETEEVVDYDILIAACLLHDVGRGAQAADPELDHAEVGAEMAVDFLTGLGWNEDRARWVGGCVHTHRHRKGRQPGSLEAKIVFDADKLDAAGALGIARTLTYEGQILEPLYIVENGAIVTESTDAESSSFFQEFNYKLRNLYTRFYTEKAKEMAAGREAIAVAFYDSLLDEVTGLLESGPKLVEERLEEQLDKRSK